VDQLGLLVEGVDPSWFRITAGTVNLLPDAIGRLEVEIRLPDGNETVAGTYDVVLRVVSREAPAESAVAHLALEILALGALEGSLSPQRVTLGWRGKAQYKATFAQRGNADALVDLVVRDPDEALTIQINPDRVSVLHASSAHSNVIVQPKKRPWVAIPRHYAFSVDVLPVQAEADADAALGQPMLVLTGALIYRPPLASLAAIPLGLRRLAMALAAAALLAALLVWFLAAPGRRGPLIERVPPTKPLVAALENAAAMPEKVAAAPEPGAGDAAGGDAPRIKRFVLLVPGVEGRTEYALEYEVEGADQVKIAGAEQQDPSAGTLPLTKVDSSEYVLEATKAGTTVNQSIGIVVLRPPEIEELVAVPDAVARGQATMLRWRAKRGDRASLGEQAVDPLGGAVPVTPSGTTTYTLVVENELGRAERSVQVRVTGG